MNHEQSSQSQKSMAKTPDCSTDQKNTTKNHRSKYLDQIVNTHTGKLQVVTKKFIDDLIPHIYKWPKTMREELINGNPRLRSFTVEEFLDEHGIPSRTLRSATGWLANNSELKEAFECMKDELGRLRQGGALANKLNIPVFMGYQYHFCPIWAQGEERKAYLKSMETPRPQTVFVKLPNDSPTPIDFESQREVPKKLSEDS